MTEEGQQGRTDQLETIFQTIMATQQTGICSVERGKGGVRQVGNVVFLHGQVVEATADGRTGMEALEWLQTWVNCQYHFVPKAPNEITIAPPAAPTTTPNAAPASFLSLITQVIPRNIPFTSEGGKPQSEGGQTTGPVQPVGPTTAPLTPRTPLPHTPIPPAPVPPPQIYGPGTPMFEQRPTSTQTPARAPYRLLHGSDAIAFMERIRLSRLHRHIFFLLDGQRTASDLVRLTKHSLDEVQRMLGDLEQCGLIKQERGPDGRF